MFSLIRKGFSRYVLSNKIILASILSVLIISALSTGISFYMSSNLLKQKNIEINAQVLKQNVSNIENMLSHIEIYLNAFLEDENFNNVLTAYSSEKNNSQDTEKVLENYLFELMSSCSGIQSFFLITPDNKLITNDTFMNKSLNYKYFSSKLKKPGVEFAWSYVKYEVTLYSDNILLTKKVKNPVQGNDTGILSVTVNNNYITNFYRYVSKKDAGFFMLTNDFKPVLSSYNMPDEALGILQESLKKTNEGFYIYKNNIYLFNRSLYTGWIGIKTIDYRKMILPIEITFRKVIIIFLICIFFSLVISNLYAAAFKSSINAIKNGMRKVVSEVLNIQISTRHLIHASTRNTLLILFCFTIFIPILVSNAFSYFMFNKALKDEILLFFSDTLGTLKTEITANMEEYEQIAHFITFNNIILDSAKSNYNLLDINTGRNNDIDRLIMKQQKIKNGAFYINVLNNTGQYIYSTIPLSRNSLSSYINIMNSANTPKMFFDTQKDYYNHYVIVLGKKVFDINEPEKILGYLFLSIYENDICDLYSKNMSGGSINTFLVTKQGTIISENKKDLIGKKINKVYPTIRWPISTNNNSFVEKIDGKECFLNFSAIQNLDWYLVSTVVINDFLNSRMLAVNINILLISIIVIILISFLMAQNISKPLQKLSSSLKKVSKGNFDISVVIDSGNEIEELSRNFNAMVMQLRTLIKEAYESKIERQNLDLKRKEAELLAFQAQIQPHFLYNTLEVIHCKAMFITGGENNVSFLISKLASFLRFVTGDMDQFITIREEIEHVQNYIDIMQNCDYKFNVRWKIDENLESCKTPSLVLQPILENAITHGLQRMNIYNGIIHLYVTELKGDILIRIADNGTGLNYDELDNLRNGLNGKISESHIGLKSVHQRIALSFGTGYGISIRSKKGKGTIIRLKLPKRIGTRF